jgi:hypothetical protein
VDGDTDPSERTITVTAPFQTSFQTFATDFGIPGILDAAITGLTVLDPTENNEPTLLLEEDDPYAVKVDWQVTGAGLCSLGGTWQVALYINDIDGQAGAAHGQLDTTVFIPVVGCQQNYSATFTQPANSVQAGLYQFVVTINHSPQGATTPPPLDQQLTENVGYAQSSPVKFTPTVDETN